LFFGDNYGHLTHFTGKVITKNNGTSTLNDILVTLLYIFLTVISKTVTLHVHNAIFYNLSNIGKKGMFVS